VRYLVVVLAVLCSLAVVTAQDAAPRFDVVSIKRSSSQTRSTRVVATDGITSFAGQSVQLLLFRAALPEMPREFENLPDWAGDRYDLRVKLPAGVRATPEMWRALLVDRFKLQSHVEQRERDGSALVLLRADGTLGPNLRPSALDCQLNSPAPDATAPAAVAPPREPRWPTRQESASQCGEQSSPGSGFLVSGGMPMAWLAASVGGLIGEEFMIDQTGLAGVYAVNLDFPPTRRSAGATVPDRAEVLAAIQEQLGLTVRRAIVPVPVFVIDHIERPSEN
jgi:uncharacterized protein (TIGR03435 family)